MINRLHTLVIKELLSYLRDPKTRLILLGPPLMQLLIFSFAGTLEVRHINIAVWDQDGSTISRSLTNRLAAASFVDSIIPVHNMASLTTLLDERKVLLGIRLEPQFSRDMAAGQPAQVQVLLDGRRANASQVALRYTNTIANQIGAELSAAETDHQVRIRHWFNPNLSYKWFIVPSLSGVLALLIAILVTSLSIARERELGTFDQLLVSPVSNSEIIIGKTIPAVLIGVLLGLIMVSAGIFLFRIPFTGSLAWLTASMLLFILSGVGIGLSVSAVSHTQQQAILGAFFVIIPIVLTSGFATPVENMPAWLETLSQVNPLRHFLIIVQGSFLKSLPASEILANLVPLCIIATVSTLFASWLVRRHLQ